eukprot:TRINITY_DN1571_c0_g2_i2.p1 TRINITY_DN1571_c0_g2~~TRINITY_DN1571_c0_g2_i2.p1  ORF type:complete len:240 (+),score=56.49 TRINITY_DN1571_c0_g2_i2:384-1103(+)
MEKVDAEKFKNHQLPLARIKKIMKSDEDVRMISAEAPVIFAKACELFIIELTYRAWIHTEEAKRRTLQKSDISACIATTDIFDFLIDLIPKDEYNKFVLKKQTPGIGGVNFSFPMPSQLNTQMLQGGNNIMGMPQFNPSMLMNMNKPPQGGQPMPGAPSIQGMQGMQGMSAMPGMQGMPNMPGMQGMQGMQGMPGMQGMQGVPGMQAMQGMPGQGQGQPQRQNTGANGSFVAQYPHNNA